MATAQYYTILRVFCNLMASEVMALGLLVGWGYYGSGVLQSIRVGGQATSAQCSRPGRSGLAVRDNKGRMRIDRIPLWGYNAPGFRAPGVLD